MQGDKDNQNDDQLETPTDHMNRFTGFTAQDGIVQESAADDKGKAGAAQDDKTKEGQDDKTKEGQDDKTDKDGKADKHASADERIGKAVAKQRAAERRADAAERRADNLEQRLTALEARLTGGAAPGNSGAQSNEDKEPDPKTYKGGEFDTRYIRDLARWEARQATRETTARSREAAETREQQEAAEAFKAQIDEFTEKATDLYDDFAEVVFDDSNKFSTTLVELCLESEQGAQIAYELALDPKEQRRIANLSPAKQAKWFAGREIEISSKAKDAQGDGGAGTDGGTDTGAEKRSKAPAPPNHQGKGSGSTGTVSASTPNFSDFERMVSAQNRR